MNDSTLLERLAHHLSVLYPSLDCAELANQLFALIEPVPAGPSTASNAESLSEADVLLITYGDSIVGGDAPPLRHLKDFISNHCAESISCVHILPFFPYSSDDGFSVIDYYEVRDDLGTWQDVSAIAADSRLMVDLVINHCSSEGQWFKQYCEGELPEFFVEASSDDDLTQVVRPRATPLLRPTETQDGTKQLWCTFGHDQVDVNFKNPQVLFEFLRIIRHYLEHGARILRLDAIGYLWKESGTPCIHLHQTHEVVRLIRTVVEHIAPGTMIITETNVPNQENLTYFGNRNEAHAIYNFSLPPLLVHALLTGDTQYLKQWIMSMPPSPEGCCYLNFTASHDGIGMRPAEGLLSDHEQLQLVETIRRHGGLLSTRRATDGSERVYELNISLFDALAGTIAGPDEYQIARFLCSQTLMMGIEGVPAFYIHSLLATPNDHHSVAETGRARSINRHRWDVDELHEKLADPQSNQAIVLNELLRRIAIRSQQPAFHPNATQFTLQISEPFFAFWRQSRDRTQSIFAIHNMSNKPQLLQLSTLNLISGESWRDLLSNEACNNHLAEIELAPYQCLWLSNRS